jgi:tetratricopeptide (TPR) repeat protein
MVELYGKIAPEVPHALHMPSHIYVRLGDWPEVIDWNERSAEVALKHPVNDSISLHYIHAIDYLVYAHLQRGEDDSAHAVYKQATERGPHQDAGVVAFHFAAVPARLAVEQRRWEDAAQLQARTPDYLPWDSPVGLWSEGLTWLARGLGGVHTGDIEHAREAEARLRELRDQAKADDEELMATYIEVERLILAGWIAHADGDDERAEALVRSAAELESSVEKHPITPGALLPPNEALGDLLMAMDRPDDALEAFQQSGRIWPARFNTLAGVLRAVWESGDEQLARQFEQKLAETAPAASREPLAQAGSN